MGVGRWGEGQMSNFVPPPPFKVTTFSAAHPTFMGSGGGPEGAQIILPKMEMVGKKKEVVVILCFLNS